MSIVVLQLPDVKQKTDVRPGKCRYCQSETFQRWGKVRKPVRDSQYRGVQAYRYRCCSCHRTFRHYPEGVDRADQTRRLRKLVSLLRVLGLCLRGVCTALAAFRVPLSHMTVWRDLQEQAELVEKQRRWRPVRVLGLDGAYVQGRDKRKHPVLVAVDLGRPWPDVRPGRGPAGGDWLHRGIPSASCAPLSGAIGTAPGGECYCHG